MPPASFKPYVKRGKTDAADVGSGLQSGGAAMRFVPVKSPEQQAALSMHRARDLLVKQRAQLINMSPAGLIGGKPLWSQKFLERTSEAGIGPSCAIP